MTKAELLDRAKPIDFIAEMAAALADGRKTRTMRVIKSDFCCAHCINESQIHVAHHTGTLICGCGNMLRTPERELIRPKHRVGDILYVREPWGTGCMGGYVYLADCPDGCEKPAHRAQEPAKTMPPEAARMFLHVTGVKAQRPLDLTIEEAIAEGIPQVHGMRSEIINWWRETFAEIYPPKQWGKNPWCYVYEFERVMPDETGS
jgi:hypothetical protein